jgi:phosphoenolpyruvate synthase/pyruvate phosphate dikinase
VPHIQCVTHLVEVAVAQLFDERNPAMKRMLGQAIEAAKRVNKPSGICGQVPSDNPDLAEWFVECGIDSISLNPDTAIKTAFVSARAEARHQRAISTRIGALSGITY